MMKILGFGLGGCWIWSQRPEARHFSLTASPGAAVELSWADLQALLDVSD